MTLQIINSLERSEGLDPRARTMLEERPEKWFEDVFGFGRVRQANRDKPGYETTEAFEARDRDIISWTWLEDIGLIARDGQILLESEKQYGLSRLRDYLDDLSRRLGET